ncbi:MAG: hypothetical protein ABIZ96_07300, partial [Gemmatimonadales bacterium]
MCRTSRAFFGLHQLHSVRLGAVRVKGGQRDSGTAGQTTTRRRSRGADGQQQRTEDEAPQFDLLPRRPTAQRAPAPLPSLPVLDERNRGTRFIGLSVNSVLNTPASTGMGFWSINPYVGCEFGCTYCYARDTHKWTVERAVRRYGGTAVTGDVKSADTGAGGPSTALPPYRPTDLPPEEAFEKEILVKTDVAEVLARTLNPARLAGHSLVIGTATDPYQPAERQFRLTRRILEVLRSYHGLSIGIITKSSLVTRDLDLLQALAQ